MYVCSYAMYVCMGVHRMFGHFNIGSCPNVQYKICTWTVTPKITGKAHENRRPTSVLRHGSSRPLLILFPCRNHTGQGHCPGETGSLSFPSRSGPETGFVAILLFLYKIIATSCLYAQSNVYVPADVPHTFRNLSNRELCPLHVWAF
jgi:hypothetical protein